MPRFGFVSCVLLASSLARAHAVTTSCANLVDAQTEPARSASGVQVVLELHSEDDHGKNTHLCQTEYIFALTHVDGTISSSPLNWGNDDAWERPIEFHIDGFSHDGRRAFAFIREGTRHAAFTAATLDLTSGIVQNLAVSPTLTRQLSPACIATLHLSALTADNQLVLSTASAVGCPAAQSWLLPPERTRNGRTTLVHPPRLPPLRAITPIDRGVTPH